MTTINDLPAEILAIIYARARGPDATSLSTQSGAFREVYTDTVISHSVRFGNALMARLGERSPTIAQKLQGCIQTLGHDSEGKSLTDLKATLIAYRRGVIAAIKALTAEELTTLKADLDPHTTPHFVKQWLSMEKRLAAAHELPNRLEKFSALYALAKEATRIGDVDKAIAIEFLFPLEDQQVTGEIRRMIILTLLQVHGDIDRALNLANGAYRRNFALWLIVEHCADAGNFDRALQVANVMEKGSALLSQSYPISNMYDHALFHIAQKLVDQGQFFRALQLGRNNRKVQDSIFIYCSEKFATHGQFPSALRCLARVSDSDYRNQAIASFIKKL
jgi:hypothetical protein